MFIILTTSDTGSKVRLSVSAIVAYWQQPSSGKTAIIYGDNNTKIVEETVGAIDDALQESYISIKKVQLNGSTTTSQE